jgi:hypothetical protein
MVKHKLENTAICVHLGKRLKDLLYAHPNGLASVAKLSAMSRLFPVSNIRGDSLPYEPM